MSALTAKTEIRLLRHERDEAVECARRLFQIFAGELDVRNWVERFPFLSVPCEEKSK